MKLIGALHLCECQDREAQRHAVLVQDGYSFLVKQSPRILDWNATCALEIRASGMIISPETFASTTVLITTSFTHLSDCLFYLLSVYGIPDEGWRPFPEATWWTRGEEKKKTRAVMIHDTPLPLAETKEEAVA